MSKTFFSTSSSDAWNSNLNAEKKYYFLAGELKYFIISMREGIDKIFINGLDSYESMYLI